ncbi:hypothetical protein [Streptomyces sp. NBC_00096]|uniref:hypothetical protein n=1 Tax=Streptomyces sp. NBC_00096 TaxID=2975650 RepID=UPI00325370FF
MSSASPARAACLAICYDGSFPETVRQLTWLGAEIINRPWSQPARYGERVTPDRYTRKCETS